MREEVAGKLAAFEFIAQTKSIRAGARSVEAMHPGQPGWLANRLQTQFTLYRDTHDWRCVLHKTKAGSAYCGKDAGVRLPREFLEHWKALCKRNQRKCKPAYRRADRRSSPRQRRRPARASWHRGRLRPRRRG